jgi:hypothetical protein
MQRLVVDAIVLAPRGMYFDAAHIQEDEILVKLNKDTYIKFRRVAIKSECFEAVEVLDASSLGPHQPSSAQGVWWLRQAAREADRDIASYQAAADRIP